MSYQCAICGAEHPGPPLSWGVPFPDAWSQLSEEERATQGECSSDQCFLETGRFFVIGNLDIPIIGSEDVFNWTTWVELKQDDFQDVHEKWHLEGRESTSPYRCRLANQLAGYSPSSLGLDVTLQLSPYPSRPKIHVQAEHQLRDQQSSGITMSDVERIAQNFLS